ncbi:MAG: GldG family protein, partial [Defluviitaleaceae bacterium]|nr:GldG family protein [Defluviitaleaceae bacterium]
AFVAVYMTHVAALTYFVNISQGSADFYNTVGYMGMVLPFFAAWLTSGLPQPLSLFLPRRLFTKLVSACALYMCALAVSLVFPAALSLYGRIDIAHIAGAYVGLALLGVVYLSLGVCLRLMVSSGVALGVFSLILYVCLYFTVFEQRFQSFVRGLPNTEDTVFLVSFGVLFLVAASLGLRGSRRTRVLPRVIAAGLVLVLLNVSAARISLRADLTEGEIFTLSHKTLDVLDTLSEPVYIYAAFPPGMRAPHIDTSREILLAYGRHPNVRLSFTPSRRVAQEGLTDIAAGSVVAFRNDIGLQGEHYHSGRKIIPPEKIFLTSYNEEALQMYIYGINLEAELTNAILYCSECDNPVLAQVVGHREQPVPQGFVDALVSANFDVTDVDITEGEIPPEISVLLVTTPAGDWGQAEAGRLTRFLDAGGSAVFALDAQNRESRHLAGVLAGFGIRLGDRLIAEGDEQHYLHISNNVLASTLPFGVDGSARRVLIPNARAVYLRDTVGRSVEAKSVIATSQYAFEAPHSWEREGRGERLTAAHDKSLGTFALAARVEATGTGIVTRSAGRPGGRETGAESATRVVVLGSTNIFDETANEFSGGENYRFLIDAINWTQNIENTPAIPMVQLTTPSLAMDIVQAVLVISLLGGALPGLILIIGLLARN